jgi:L,D-peptidoglycan transpeptidase YkuD (ErfK/YbiS/YcfS/YnhG family)
MAISRRFLVVATSAMLTAPSFAMLVPKRADLIRVRAARGAITGTLSFNGHTYACTLGRSGIVEDKHEGDGGTPAGLYPMREVRYRPDRLLLPRTRLRTVAIASDDGWCDDPADPAYNKPVKLPYPHSAEVMARDDSAYDALAVIGYNDMPPVPGKGSAIFLHIIRTAPDGTVFPTTGCIALATPDLLAVLAAVTPNTLIDIRAL